MKNTEEIQDYMEAVIDLLREDGKSIDFALSVATSLVGTLLINLKDLDSRRFELTKAEILSALSTAGNDSSPVTLN